MTRSSELDAIVHAHTQLSEGIARSAASAEYSAASDRQPKGDHNRRLALGLDVDAFAMEAGVTAEALRDYEGTWPDHDFDLRVAARVGAALDRLEANPPPTQKVSNGPAV